MPDKKPDPRKRRLFSFLTDKEQMGELGASLGRLARELRGDDERPTHEQVQADVQQALTDIDNVEAELQALTEQVETLKASDVTQKELLRDNRDLLVELMERMANLEVAIEQGKEQAECDDEKKRWQATGDKLKWLIALLIGASGTALYELLIGDTLYPWLKQRWSELVKPTGVQAQPASPLPDPQPTRIEFPQSSYRPGLAIDWVTIPATSFWMGSDPRVDRDAQKYEQPQHRVYLPTYQIARVSVTNAQYKRFVDATRHRAPDHWTGWSHSTGQGAASCHKCPLA